MEYLQKLLKHQARVLGFWDQVVKLKWVRTRKLFKGEKLDLGRECFEGANIQIWSKLLLDAYLALFSIFNVLDQISFEKNFEFIKCWQNQIDFWKLLPKNWLVIILIFMDKPVVVETSPIPGTK
jgi:hypothetical protein